METKEKERQGILIENNFSGATIHNIVINGNMVKNGHEEYHEEADKRQGVNGEQVVNALRLCEAFLWGNSAYSIAFCVCRDVFNLENNASGFERMLAENGISIPMGTVNSAMSRNPWMKYHIDRWEEKGVQRRALKLRDEFRQQMENVAIAENP